MEANFFRFLAPALAAKATGSAVKTIFQPADGLWTIVLSHLRETPNILFRPAKNGGLLFLAALRPENPAAPSARAMWFRKRLKNRRVMGHALDWPGLRLALRLSLDGREALILDARRGPELVSELDEAFFHEPSWPSLAEILENREIWREYPQVSPPLRRVLGSLPEASARELLGRLASGKPEGFYIHPGKEASPLVWPPVKGEARAEFPDPLEAAAAFGEPLLFEAADRDVRDLERARRRAWERRIERALASIDKDRERLLAMVARKAWGEAIKARLYQLKNLETPEAIEIDLPGGERIQIELDTTLDMTANMERFFAQAAKGERGLTAVARRRAQLAAELAKGPPAKKGPRGKRAGKSEEAPAAAPGLPARFAGLALKAFTSSDGLLMVRGKNSAANHKLVTRAASPFDLWFHALGVPGAHVVVKLSHPGQEVPGTTLRQAACLALLSSARSGEAKAEAVYARVRDVRAIKGAAQGRVKLDKVLGSLMVEVDPELEKRLAFPG